MIILIWLNILMHFMHVIQMIFLLNVYMLITKFTFYSLTMQFFQIHKWREKSTITSFLNVNFVQRNFVIFSTFSITTSRE